MRREITRRSKEWPSCLDELGPHDPPQRLFLAGKCLEREKKMVAIVGTRRPTGAGLETARRLATGLAEADFIVVSGLAIGIDAAAHEATLEAGGHAVAVLGCGLDVDYPGRNRELKARIATAGTLVTEYPSLFPPSRHTFPRRNRIIAGLSMGVVVVEGAMTSGALVTARLALDADRNVYAVPGSVRNPMAQGPNELIRTARAGLITSVDHIFEDLAPRLDMEARPGPGAERSSLQKTELEVLRALDDIPSTPDRLGSAVTLSPGKLSVTLSRLEIRGLVERNYRGYSISSAGARERKRAMTAVDSVTY
jgi:DNA processing protein